MSDDNDPGSVPFDSLPEPLQEIIRAHILEHDKAKMTVQANIHTSYAFLEALPEEHLRELRIILLGISNQSSMADFFAGLTTAMMKSKFGVCAACGEKHDSVPEAWSQELGLAPKPGESWTDFMSRIPSEFSNNAANYGMSFVPNDWPKVRCEGCGTISASLEDRMRRPAGVGGCSTCQQKQKWG